MREYTFNLVKTANQRFNTKIGEHDFIFEFRTFRSMMYASVYIDGSLVQAGVRCVPNQNLFCHEVNSAAGGYFKFVSKLNDYPLCDQFDGATCVLTFFYEG